MAPVETNSTIPLDQWASALEYLCDIKEDCLPKDVYKKLRDQDWIDKYVDEKVQLADVNRLLEWGPVIARRGLKAFTITRPKGAINSLFTYVTGVVASHDDCGDHCNKGKGKFAVCVVASASLAEHMSKPYKTSCASCMHNENMSRCTFNKA